VKEIWRVEALAFAKVCGTRKKLGRGPRWGG